MIIEPKHLFNEEKKLGPYEKLGSEGEGGEKKLLEASLSFNGGYM